MCRLTQGSAQYLTPSEFRGPVAALQEILVPSAEAPAELVADKDYHGPACPYGPVELLELGCGRGRYTARSAIRVSIAR